ncbi:MAG: hypothetical protein IK024_01560 [Treponema sp.]|nr:hypothetical protein [Treponema sp.]
MQDEILGKQLTRTEIGKQIEKEVKKMNSKERQAYEKRSERNYEKIMKALQKK